MSSPERSVSGLPWHGGDRRLLLLSLGMFAIGTDSFVMAPLLPVIAGEFRIGIPAAAQLVAVYSLSYALLSPFVAVLTSHWPRARTLRAGLVVFTAGNVLVALAPGFAVALLARAVTGLGAALFAPMASATAAELVAPSHRGRALSVLMIGLSSATALGAPLGTLFSAFITWRLVMICIAGVSLAVLFASLPVIPSGLLPTRVAMDQLLILRKPAVAAVLTATFVALTGFYLSYTYISLVFDRVAVSESANLALLQSVWGISGVLGAAVAGRLTDRYGGRIVINGLLALAAVNFAMLPLTGAHLTSAVLAVAVWGVCGWGFVVPQQHRLISILPAMAPVLISLYATAVYGAASASSLVGALGLRALSGHMLPVIGAGLVLIGLAAGEYARRVGGDKPVSGLVQPERVEVGSL